jgi:type IV pilus assembly protein PilA
MLARLRKAQENNEGGFTLIELLVVMIIIGILAAIAIPTFLNQKKKAAEASAKADVGTIGKEIAAYFVDGTNDLAVSSSAAGGNWQMAEDGAAAGVFYATGKLSKGNTATGTATVATGAFCVQVVPNNDGATWSYTNTAGLVQGTC